MPAPTLASLPAAAARHAAEREILSRYATLAGSTPLAPGPVRLTEVSSVHVAGVATDRSQFVAVSTQVLALTPEELPEVAQHVFTLSLLRCVAPQARMVLAFAGRAAADSVRGWVSRVQRTGDIEVVAVELDEATTARLVAAQLAGRRR